ncbi:MAG: hypothetical protein ACOX0A_06955 [Thermoguttaceae bacterium]|jgi:hypothetical protein
MKRRRYFTWIFLCAAIVSLRVLTGFAVAQEALHFDFETGDLEGWQIVQGENTKPIGSRELEFHGNPGPYQKSGKYYLTTLESSANDAPTDDTLCIIESPVFKLSGNALTFLVGGAGRRENVRVELALVKEDGDIEPVLVARGEDNQGLRKVEWDVSEYQGELGVIRVVDLETGSWAHIRCDSFSIPGTRDAQGDALRREFLERIEREREEREAALRDAALEALPDAVLYVKRRQYPLDHHNTATIFQRGEINEGSFTGGSSLVVWFPGDDTTKTLLEVPEGVVRDPALSFDATKIIFSVRRSREDDYHIAEIDLDYDRPTITLPPEMAVEDLRAIDGFRQLTFVKGASDIDPIYLPSGEIVFASTREPKYCMCNRHIMCNLHKMNADGSNIEQIGKSTLFEGHPALLSDGRIIYDRWEYVDRNFGDAQGVWVANPDGSKHEIYWGNNTASPGGVVDARPLPYDNSQFVCVLTSCHDRPWGAIALIDRRLGVDGKTPVLQTWPPETIDWVSDEPASDPFLEAVRYDTFMATPRKYEDPFPLEDDFILASGQTGQGEEMGIYVLDPDGGATLVHADAPGCFDPQPILPTDPPQIVADRVNLDDPNGYFYVSNVYEGFGMEKVEPGSVKYLRVVESPEKRFWTHPDWQGSGTQAPGMAWDDFNNKRILGTVPVASDGSVSFAVPAEKFVYFQLLDENEMLVQSMRSGIMVRPGETNACVGCHESRVDAPLSGTLAASAEAGAPETLEPWLGKEPRFFSYYEEVQPVFDKYCVECHEFGKRAGRKLVLSGDRNLVFNTSYWQIRSKNYVRVPGAGPHNTFPAYEWGSTRSKLAEIFLEGHEDPEIDAQRKELGLYVDKTTDPEAFKRVITWIDINAPYYPTYASAYRDNAFGRSPLTYAEMETLEAFTGMRGLELAAGTLLDRPEMSPCLNRWGAAEALNSPEYHEAVAIIAKGRERLLRQGRGEESDFQPVAEIEIEQQRRYEYFERRAALTRDAIKEGRRLNDLELDALLAPNSTTSER